MARFSRLRRSARLLLAAGFGLAASPVWSGNDCPECLRPSIVTASKAVAIDAYISGFKTMIPAAAAQKYNVFPATPNGSTLAQVILKQNARQGKNILLESAPVPTVQHHTGPDGLERIGIDFDIDSTPRIIITEEDEESLLGVETESLELEIRPLTEPGLLALNDAAPGENPPAETNLADYAPHLPGGDDAPAENPGLETSAARIVSPTMSPDEYLAAFAHLILGPNDTPSRIVPVVHEEPAAATPAEAHAFDGPAQITLHDSPNTPGQGFVWPAQPVAEESLDELAARLEREFLARAVSGQLQTTGACPAADKAANCQEATACKSSQCQSDKCQPGQCGLLDCPGCPVGSPCGACCTASTVAATAAAPANSPRSQWTLPTPTVTINPYAAGPGAGTVLPRDIDFYAPRPMEVPAGSPTCGPQAYPGPAMFAPAPGTSPSPAITPCKTPIIGESLELHRDISRTLEQLADRCESHAMFEKADELRDLAREYRMAARILHQRLSAMAPMPGPMPAVHPVSWYPAQPMMPYPMPVPATYAPELTPPALPVAQPIVAPRY